MKRVTDLDDFSLTQVWRPYQSKWGYDERLNKPPHGLDKTALLLQQDSEWSRLVLDRIKAIGFSFPTYVNHPLVDLVRKTNKP